MLVVWTSLLLLLPALLPRLEQQAYDLRLAAANSLRPERISMDPRIVVIGIEPSSYQAIPKHPVFWTDLYVRVAGLALQRGARVVGLDVLPTYWDPAQAPVLRELLRYPGKVKAIAYWDQVSDSVNRPAEEFTMALGWDNLALANLSLDEDGVARRQVVAPIRAEHRVWEFLAPAMAGAAPGAAALHVNLSAAQPRRYRFDEVLRGAGEFEGAYVLIGSRTHLDQDLVRVSSLQWRPGRPLTQTLFGVDYQAQVLNTLLTRRALRPVHGGWLLLPCLAAAAWAGWTAGLPLGALLCLLLWFGYGAGSLLALTERDWLLPLTPGLLGIPLTWTLAVGLRSRADRLARRQLLDTMSGYVAPEILREMLAEPAQVMRSLTERRQVTVMFCDINGFSQVAEQQPAETVAVWLDAFYREVAGLIFEQHGTIVRFVGDQFMVLFGAPRSLPEPERRALKTALAIHARLAENRENGLPGFHDVKIGIHCGPLLLAVIGDARKREYTAIGDVANVAARIQDLCKKLGAGTLVSAEVVRRTGPDPEVEFRAGGSWPVKGRQAEVEVYSAHPRSSVAESE